MIDLDKEFPIPLDNDLTRIASITFFIGALFIRLAEWTVMGWIVVALGFITLWLAHNLAVAPYIEEPARHSERLLP